MQTGSGAQPSSYLMGKTCSLPAIEVAGTWSRPITFI